MGSKGIKLKDSEGNSCYPCPYFPVGSIYLSISNTNPSTYFGGTWKQITADAYLKIVTSSAGNTGGTSSSHKIPVTSIPAHKHTIEMYNSSTEATGYGLISSDGFKNRVMIYNNSSSWTTKSTGGGQAYYPYYYGVYLFVRTA